jgi:hypothetical protein
VLSLQEENAIETVIRISFACTLNISIVFLRTRGRAVRGLLFLFRFILFPKDYQVQIAAFYTHYFFDARTARPREQGTYNRAK